MDSRNGEEKIEHDEGFKGFAPSEITCGSSEVTKSGIVENEPKKDDKVATVEATSNSSCDKSNISQLNNSNECVDCDIKVNTDRGDKNMTANGGTDLSKSDTSAAVDLDASPTTTTENCISQLENISIQEVMKKVDKMNIVEKQVSSVIIKNESSSLRNLLMYHTDSSDNEEENQDFDASWQHHVFPHSSSTSESDFESQECVEISDDDEDNEFVLPNNKNQHKNESKPDEDLDIGPSLDISDLQIDYEREQFIHIGQISNFINATVTVDTIENVASYNIETVLFVEDKTSKKPLGGITDVIGPVSRPVYCIQLPDVKEIEKMGLKEGMKVYSAPKSPYTKYVFLKDLLKMKGTDASWIGDQEAPSDAEDTTDEEDETEEGRTRKRAHNGSLERHKQFEKAKNRSNIMKTQVADMMDRYRNVQRGRNIHMFPHGFDPKVPPPTVPQNVGLFSPVPSFRRSMSNPRFAAPLPEVQRRFPHPWNPRSPQTHPRHNHTNFFANNVSYHRNSPGPSHQNYY